MKLSIILPVYNVEKYIERCIMSVENQDISKDDYEIIVVDDGTKDRSAEIAESMNEKFGNIKIVHKPNGGLSSARNKGLEYATGEYVWFIDSDDYIEENVLKMLTSKIYEDRLDLLMFNVYDVWPDKEMAGFDVDEQPDRILSGMEYIKGYDIGKSAWCFIVKREILTDNNLFFTEGIIHEDYEFTLRLYEHVERMTFTPMRVYNYLHREGSITTTVNEEQTLKSIHSWQTIIEKETTYFANDSEYSKIAQSWISSHKFKGLCVLLFYRLPAEIKIKEYKKFKRLGSFNLSGANIRDFKLRILLSIIRFKSLYYILLHFFRVSKDGE